LIIGNLGTVIDRESIPETNKHSIFSKFEIINNDRGINE
jgi:hypothetical protein